MGGQMRMNEKKQKSMTTADGWIEQWGLDGRMSKFRVQEAAQALRADAGALLVDLHEPGRWRPDLLDYAMLHATDAAVDYSTRAYLIKLMAVMCRPYPDLAREVETFLDVLPPDAPPSLRAARRQALLLLRQRSRRNGRSG